MTDVMKNLYTTIVERKANPIQNSYTNYLFDAGVDKICKKIGEEAAETILAAKNSNPSELVGEVSDLLYHLLVLLANESISWNEVDAELTLRSGKIGNKKEFRNVDPNT